MRELSYLSLEYVEAEVSATTPDGQPIDPAGLPVSLAFVAVGAEPGDLDWHTAVFLRETSSQDPGARPGVFGVLIGPGALVLDRGDYDAWHDTPDTPERPRAPFGKLRIT